MANWLPDGGFPVAGRRWFPFRHAVAIESTNGANANVILINVKAQSGVDRKFAAMEQVTAQPTKLSRFFESRVEISAPADVVFAHLDDHRRLSSHMSQSSWAMIGSRMDFRFDAAEGRAVGSKIELYGKILGIPLSVDEVVTVHVPPLRKEWETIGTPRLFVIGDYRMGFEIIPHGKSASLRVFIHYGFPEGPVTFWLGRIFGAAYARWCTIRMTDDTGRHFR
jgi:hypothetical protein